MKHTLLRDSVGALKCIRAELQGNVESSVMVRLDKVIKDLEAAEQSGTDAAITASELLRLLGSLIEKIPAIAEVIGNLMR